MRLRDIPQAWKDAIAVDPGSKFARKAAAVQDKINRVNFHHDKIEMIRQKSRVGTRLLIMFRERVAAVPCSDCKSTMRRLNQMTVAQIRSDIDSVVMEIEKNASKAGVSFWARVMATADKLMTGGIATRVMIRSWIDEALTDEEAEHAAIKPQ